MFKFLTKAVLLGSLLAAVAVGQSRDQNYPTGVEGPEVSGVIKAREIGDSRLTSYFYAFDGSQGDVFVNVVTTNFAGDVDVFTRDTLRPLTKMVIFGNAGQQLETGRVVYLRKPERLILRIQGRTPNDEPATFQIKFAGSFIAVKERAAVEEPTIAREETRTGSQVNSVGTIVALPPKPTPSPVEKAATADAPIAAPKPDNKTLARTTSKRDGSPPETTKKPEVVVKSSVKEPTAVRSTPPMRTAVTKKEVAPKEPPAPDPLASINLKIQLKSGSEILRPLNEVLKFSVDKGVLTVIMKTGGITRYSMVTEVSKVTIE
jgi:hypothetical protein